MLNDPKYVRQGDLMEAELGDELVALDATAGHCYGFNSVATNVWRHLEQPTTFAELQSILLEEYDVNAAQCRLELRALLDDMAQQGLISASE